MFKENNFELKIIFYTKGYGRRKWKNPLNDAEFDYSILKTLKIRFSEESYLFIPFNLINVLLKEKPKIIITIGFSFATIFIFLYHLFTKVPYIIWSGEVERKAIYSSDVIATFMVHKDSKAIAHSIRRILRKILIRYSSALIAYGTKAGEYLRSLDSTRPIFYVWNAVDTEYFSESVEKMKAKKDKIFEELKLSQNTIHILTVGYLTKGKRIGSILHSLRKVKQNHSNSNFSLHIVGDGSERQRLEQLVKKLNLEKNVRFWGYKQKEEVVDFYAIADIFIFASTYDIWGLVLNEAMAVGLPVIASKYAGSTYDLIQDGINGFVVDPYNIEEMAKKIKILIENPELRKNIGECAQRTIKEKFTLEKSAQGFLEAVKYVLEKT